MSENRYDSSNPGPCVQKIKDLMKHVRPMIERWPAFHKYTLGEEIMKEMLLMLRLSTKARLHFMNQTTLKDLYTSKEVLKALTDEANGTIFTDKSGKERRLLTDHAYGVWAGMIDEIGRLIWGWMESVKDRKSGSR